MPDRTLSVPLDEILVQATQRAERAEALVRRYEHVHGPIDGGGSKVPGEPGDMTELLREADSFPWKRGNPGYLADYTTIELLDEVTSRVAHLETSLGKFVRSKPQSPSPAVEDRDAKA